MILFKRTARGWLCTRSSAAASIFRFLGLDFRDLIVSNAFPFATECIGIGLDIECWACIKLELGLSGRCADDNWTEEAEPIPGVAVVAAVVDDDEDGKFSFADLIERKRSHSARLPSLPWLKIEPSNICSLLFWWWLKKNVLWSFLIRTKTIDCLYCRI